MKIKKNSYIILSSLCLIYFTILIYLSFNTIVVSDLLVGILELITIPFVILVFFMSFLSVKKWYLENFDLKSTNFYSILILVITLLLVIISTIANI
jgi:asparagine N-glycosylation enzyme membrane subunit Stt3